MKLKHFILITLLILIAFLGAHMYVLRSAGHYPWNEFSKEHRRDLIKEKDVSYISKWMTFDYINRIYNLPDSYLKDIFSIQDARYPFLTIAKYAESVHIDSDTFTQEIQNSVSDSFTVTTQ